MRNQTRNCETLRKAKPRDLAKVKGIELARGAVTAL